MRCENPYVKTPTGVKKWHLFSEQGRLNATPFGCGQCIGCRINKARMWQLRILMESSVTADNCFVTLSYEDENLQFTDSGLPDLIPQDLTKYFKRLRKNSGKKLRYFAVGEYGKQTQRPHYHIAIFGLSELDLPVIDSSWGMGFTHIGELNENTANYISGYVTKGWTFKKCTALETRHPEFMRCSKHNGGIGYGACVQIAKQLQQKGHKNLVNEIRVGSKLLPLGQYMTSKLSQLLDLDQSILDENFFHYQKTVLPDLIGEDGNVKLNAEINSAPAILSMTKKAKIFSQKRDSL